MLTKEKTQLVSCIWTVKRAIFPQQLESLKEATLATRDGQNVFNKNASHEVTVFLRIACLPTSPVTSTAISAKTAALFSGPYKKHRGFRRAILNMIKVFKSRVGLEKIWASLRCGKKTPKTSRELQLKEIFLIFLVLRNGKKKG